jgi:hypothetical protein
MIGNLNNFINNWLLRNNVFCRGVNNSYCWNILVGREIAPVRKTKSLRRHNKAENGQIPRPERKTHNRTWKSNYPVMYVVTAQMQMTSAKGTAGGT